MIIKFFNFFKLFIYKNENFFIIYIYNLHKLKKKISIFENQKFLYKYIMLNYGNFKLIKKLKFFFNLSLILAFCFTKSHFVAKSDNINQNLFLYT